MGKGDGEGGANGKEERIAVPAMPLPMAIICCIVNVILPGFGTIIAGFTVFCCSRNEDLNGAARCGSCCISFGIGLLQLILVGFCLIGWIWSCIWGCLFIGMSASYYHTTTEADSGAVTRQPGQVVTTTHISHGYGGPPPGPGPYQPAGYAPPPAYTAQHNPYPPPGYSAGPSVAHPPGVPSDGKMYGQGGHPA